MKNFFYLFLGLLFCLSSCNSNPLAVHLKEGKTIPIHYANIDSLFYKQSLATVKQHLENIHLKYGSLLFYELSQNLRQRISDTSSQEVYDFYHSDYISAVEKAKLKYYKKLPQHEANLTRAFRYLNYHFGDSVLPYNIFFINKLFSTITCSDSSIAVGIEGYISPKDSIIKKIPGQQLYEWQRNRMNIHFLERDILFSWIRTKLFPDINAKLAQHIVQAGKVLYILNACFPDSSAAYILRYSPKKYKWAVKNEDNVWDYLVKQQLLFKNDIKIKTNFLNKGPATEGLPKGAPDRMGQFIGYRIVKSYMNQNKNVTLRQLVKTKYNLILQSYEIQ